MNASNVPESSHFSAGVFFKKDENGWYILSVTDARFLKETKLPGGTNNDKPWENKIETLSREFQEEAEYSVLEQEEVYAVEKPGHTKFFFLVEANGNLPIGERRDVEEADGERLIVGWMELNTFASKVFRNHKDGFIKAFLKKAENDSAFASDNKELLEKLNKN